MSARNGSLTALEQADAFVARHIGPREGDVAAMLEAVGYESLDALMDAAVPASIRAEIPEDFPESRTERDVLAALAELAGRNRVARSMIGLGYHDTLTPPVIQRNILENPGWYTAYTPYQPEISQGRLEALLNFQTMVMDLTGLSCTNASLLDEATAAAEAMHMSHGIARNGSDRFFVSAACLPQTIAVVQTRAEAIGIEVEVGDHRAGLPEGPFFGVLLQYPEAGGAVTDYRGIVEQAHAQGAIVTVAADLLSLVLLTPPGEFGADIAVGSSQRFGVPLGYGGPHAAFFATHEKYRRAMPGRIVGVSVDSPRATGAEARAPDPRAAHPAREGDQQHLHCPGAARRDRRHVRGLSRAGGAEADRAARPPPRRHPGVGARTPRLRDRERELVRHAHGPRAGQCRGDSEAGRRSGLQPAAHRRRPHRHRLRRDHRTGRYRSGVACLRRRRRPRLRRGRAGRKGPVRAAGGAGARDALPRASGVSASTTPRPSCCATCGASRARTSPSTRP